MNKKIMENFLHGILAIWLINGANVGGNNNVETNGFNMSLIDASHSYTRLENGGASPR